MGFQKAAGPFLKCQIFFQNAARPILMGFQKSGRTDLKGIQKNGQTYLYGVFKKAAYLSFITPKGVKAKRQFLLY